MEETNESKDALEAWNTLWGNGVSKDGFVATVDPSELINVWRMGRERQAAEHAVSSTGGAIGMSVYKSMCSPGADVAAVWYRLSMLGLCEADGMLEPYKSDGAFTDAVFRVAATFPMKRIEIDVEYQGPPFDPEEFVNQVERASAG